MHVFVGGIGLSLGAVGPRASGSLLPTGWQPRDNTAQSELWWAFQKTLAGEAAAYQPPPAREASGLVLTHANPNASPHGQEPNPKTSRVVVWRRLPR